MKKIICTIVSLIIAISSVCTMNVFGEDKGVWAIPPTYGYATRDFHEGLAVVEVNNLYGFVDKTGKVVIQPQFADNKGREDFSEGLACVRRAEDGFTGYIDKTGQWVIEPRALDSAAFHDGMALIITGTYMDGTVKFGFIDKTGKIVVAPQYRSASDFSEGLAKVGNQFFNGSFGLIDKTGKLVVPMQIENAEGGFGYWVDDLMLVTMNGKRGFIDKTGNWVEHPLPDPTITTWQKFREGLTVASKEGSKYGFIDQSGKWVIDPQFATYAGYGFHDGLAGVRLSNGRYGYIDKTGKFVIEPKYFMVGAFSEGLAPVQLEVNGKWGYIDTSGKMVIEPQFQNAHEFSEGMAWAQSYGDDGYRSGAIGFIANPLTPQQQSNNKVNNQTSSIKVMYNGKELVMTLPILMKKDRTFYPMNDLLTSLGAQVTWDATTNTATGKIEDKSVSFRIGANTYGVNGVAMPVVPGEEAFIDNDRTYIPIRSTAEALGFTVTWDSVLNTIQISDLTN